MISSPDSPVFCPSCKGVNAPDSKFCRHCGHAMDGELATASPAPASDLPQPEAVVPAVVAGVVPTVAAPENGGEDEADAALSSPGEIDGRRARQLLERAHGLSDRGDTTGAILACRQAIALAPGVEGGHAMLGALLERSGDLTHAVQAFEKAAQLAPESGARRDVERLREKMGAKPDAPTFHFDDAELYEDETSPAQTPGTTTTPAAGQAPQNDVAPAVVAVAGLAAMSAVAEKSEANAPAAAPDGMSAEPAATPPTGADSAMVTGAVAAALPPSRENRVVSAPARDEPGAGTNSPFVPPSTPIGSRVVAPTVAAPVAARVAARVVNPVAFADTDAKPQSWSALWARPSYFGRSLPLVGATILALGFLGYARNVADARNLANAPGPVVASAALPGDVSSEAVPPASTTGSQGSNLPALAPVGSAPVANGGFPISNQAVQNPALSAPPATRSNGAQTSRPAPATRAAASPGAVNSTRPAPRNAPRRIAPSPQLLAPAPIPAPGNSRPANPRGAARGGSNDFTLPAPIIAPPAPAAPATSVLPSGGTSALNPAGASGRGYVRITQGRVGSQLPQRPAGRAGDAERAAAAAARGGSTSQAIDGLTTAINANSSDAGFKFQQRATLFLGQGDYSRAADDFQSAISAYNDQIARGDQVASARAGLRAARSGLNVALAGDR